MAGGTGGHVFPGLAVAKQLREQGVEVHWLGTAQGLEARVVPEANFPLHTISISGIRGKGMMASLGAPVKILSAINHAKKILKEIKPDVVLGMGGFASGPGGLACKLLRIPLVIHEQNAKAGLTNRMLSKIAVRVLEGFPGAFKPSTKIVMVGNPVRSEIENLPSPGVRFAAHTLPFRLLVLGGSLGAQALNEVVPKALSLISSDQRPAVFHQAGDKLFHDTENLYKSMGINAEVIPFIQDMAEAYSMADVVICRAGALTVSELCVVGLGAILVPYPHAADDHQTANAGFMVKLNAAICVQQSELTAERLADILRQIGASPEMRLSMANAAYERRRIHIAQTICQILKEVAELS